MSDQPRRTWPQRLTFAFVLVVAFACFATAGALAAGQWVLSQRNLVVLEETAEQFVPSASDTPVVMPGDTTTTLAPGETTTTVTIPLVEPDADHVHTGMKVKLTTYSLGTDDHGTEAIGFAFEPA